MLPEYKCKAVLCDFTAETMKEIVSHSRHNCDMWKLLRAMRS